MSNCAHRWDCSWCKDYSDYAPYDVHIKSPKQLRNKEEKKKKRKIKKISDASKRGKANRRNGRQAERKIEAYLQSLGIDAQRVPMSGALKSNNLIGGKDLDKFAGDIRIKYGDDEYFRVECKRNIRSNAWYRLLDTGLIHIKGFCYGLRKDLFEYLINGLDLGEVTEVEDSKFKLLHKYFDQDDSDIVVVTKPYCDPLFFLREDVFATIRDKKGGNEHGCS